MFLTYLNQTCDGLLRKFIISIAMIIKALGLAMDPSLVLWLSVVSIFCAGVILACYLVSKGREHKYVIKGLFGITAGILLLIALFFPWVKLVEYGAEITGLEIGDLFAFLLGNQIVQVLTIFMLLFSFLTILGGFMFIVGYELGMQVISYSSGLALFLSLIVVLGIGTIPSTEIYVALEISPGIYIIGAILGLISTRLEYRIGQKQPLQE